MRSFSTADPLPRKPPAWGGRVVGRPRASDNPLVQAQLDRLALLSPRRNPRLERIGALLERLGNPERALPPALHVAGTHGKARPAPSCAPRWRQRGSPSMPIPARTSSASTSASASPDELIETSRCRLAAETLDAAEHAIELLRATTAAAFLAFSRTPAMPVSSRSARGRLDATNVVPAPLSCGIAELGHDHHAFLGDRSKRSRPRKRGSQSGRAARHQLYPAALAARVREVGRRGRPLAAARERLGRVGAGRQAPLWRRLGQLRSAASPPARRPPGDERRAGGGDAAAPGAARNSRIGAAGGDGFGRMAGTAAASLAGAAARLAGGRVRAVAGWRPQSGGRSRGGGLFSRPCPARRPST